MTYQNVVGEGNELEWFTVCRQWIVKGRAESSLFFAFTLHDKSWTHLKELAVGKRTICSVSEDANFFNDFLNFEGLCGQMNDVFCCTVYSP